MSNGISAGVAPSMASINPASSQYCLAGEFEPGRTGFRRDMEALITPGLADTSAGLAALNSGSPGMTSRLLALACIGVTDCLVGGGERKCGRESSGSVLAGAFARMSHAANPTGSRGVSHRCA